MQRPRSIDDAPPEACEVIDFDEALLSACPAEVQADLLAEARLLAGAFSNGRKADLEAMAVTLSAGGRDAELGRSHARKLACALKRLARQG